MSADMTDKELLELAAKAAGIYKDALDCEWYDPHGYVRPDWNPLNDDGDALRLAVKLEMLLDLCGDETAAYCQEWCREKKENDAYATTRRAIVRAAAEVGKLK